MTRDKKQGEHNNSRACIPTPGENQMLNILRAGNPQNHFALGVENFRHFREHLESPIGRPLLDEIIQESNRRINRVRR